MKTEKELREIKKGIRLIVTDLDDTAVRPDNSISAYTVSVFERCREKGILTAIATARLTISAEAEAAVLCPDIQIVSNGGMALSGGRVLFFHGMGLERTNLFLQRLLEEGAENIVTGCKSVSYWNSERIEESRTLKKAVFNSYEKPLTEEACQILFTLEDTEAVERLKKEFSGFSWISYRNGRHAVLAQGVSKAAALKETAACFGISLQETAAFGDDEGDLEMMQICGLCAAVENAIPKVKAAADEIAQSNAIDGVARYIEREILCNP